jgi:hypothetical protein
MPEIHIYPLSRLVYANAGGYQRLLQELREGKQFAGSYYAPFRHLAPAVFSADPEAETLALIRNESETRRTPRWPRIAEDNQRAYLSFRQLAQEKISELIGIPERTSRTPPAIKEGVEILGNPHMIARDKRGRIRYVSLQTSAWDANETKAYQQLLILIVAARYDAGPESIMWLDLGPGRREIPIRASSRAQQRCTDALKLYSLLTAGWDGD